MNKKQKKLLIRIIAAALLTAISYFLPAKGLSRFALYLLPYLIVGYDILLKAMRGIKNLQLFDENFLMSVATIGAFVLGLIQSGDYIEAVAVMLFYQTGELFQSCAVGKSRRNIGELMDIRPDCANVEINGEIEQRDPDEIEVGTVIVVRPGERVPIDGVVVEGVSSVDAAALTGESAPRDVAVGDEIISGCVNQSGLLKIKTTKEFGDSTVSRILELVENASSRKSRSENFITRFAKVYTPAVCGGAAALAVLPPLIGGAAGFDASWSTWIYRALTFLVASCPCALVISIPLSFFAGLGGAGHNGILIKGSNYLEALSKTDCLVFDKTGTLTHGVFEVNAIHHNERPEAELIEYAALVESASCHPIAQSLKNACTRPLDLSRVSDVREFGGAGICAVVDGLHIAVGNDKLMEMTGVEYRPCHKIGTIIHVAINDRYEGHIVISDRIKEGSAEAVRELKKCGVDRIVMLTGDSPAVAEEVARTLGINEVRAELLPADKVACVEQFMAQKRNGRALAFAGDGINDAPVLSRADIGIAMGALGSDAAIEAADVVLMDDDPRKIVKAIGISRKCLRIVYENIVFAISVKAAALILVALGFAGMWIAVFADVGVMVIAILNAIRTLFIAKNRV